MINFYDDKCFIKITNDIITYYIVILQPIVHVLKVFNEYLK